jgi:hypothetical protein
MENVSDETVEDIKIHILGSTTCPPSKIVSFMTYCGEEL